MLTFADVWQALSGQALQSLRPFTIASFCVDSRRCVSRSLFVALKGEQSDGHRYITDALARGAQYIIADVRDVNPQEVRPAIGSGTWVDLSSAFAAGSSDSSVQPPEPLTLPVVVVTPNSLRALQEIAGWWRRKFSGQVVGITGSIGKTVTKEVVASVLSQRYRTFKSEGNLNSETGLPLALLMMEGRPERMVLEMGMYDLGEIQRLAEISQPRIGVVTNVGPSHLERLKSLERIAEAKAELVQAIPPDGWAILNGDDERVRAMRASTRARAMFYGLEPTNDVWASEVEGLGLQGIRFWLHHTDEQPLHVRIPLLGQHSVHTALAGAAVGLAEELSWEEIIRGLQQVSGQLRLVAVPGFNGSTLLDDTYNASPASSIAALNLLCELNGRKIAVLADMLELGNFEREGHLLVGGRAAQVCDVLITVGARARTIGQSAIEAGLPPERVQFCANKSDCIERLKEILQAGDMVLIKGSRGMAMEAVVAALTSE